MHIHISLPALALLCALSLSCNNPADQTADAEVGPALQKTVDSGPKGASKWSFTENSYIEFTGSKINGGTQVGRFTNISGHFTIKDGEPVGNNHEVEIDMNAISTEKEKLTSHLKNEDFFDVPSHPVSNYDVTSITKKLLPMLEMDTLFICACFSNWLDMLV